MHNGCAMDIKNICRDFNIDLFTYIPSNRQHSEYIMDLNKAQYIWNEHLDNFLNSDIIFFSDTTPMAWSVLQNLHLLESHQKVLIWITNRFNYAVENNKEYYQLLNRIKDNSKVYFLFANDFEKYYIEQFIDIQTSKCFLFLPYGKRNILDYKCDFVKNTSYMPYVMNYENETKFYNLIDELNLKNIQFMFKKERTPENQYCGPFELKNCSCIIHIPYSWGTIAFSEYMSLGLPFVIPTIDWMSDHFGSHNLWFQTSKNIELIKKYSLWYQDKHSEFMTYFSNIDNLIDILQNYDILKNKSKLSKLFSENTQNKNLQTIKEIIQG